MDIKWAYLCFELLMQWPIEIGPIFRPNNSKSPRINYNIFRISKPRALHENHRCPIFQAKTRSAESNKNSFNHCRFQVDFFLRNLFQPTIVDTIKNKSASIKMFYRASITVNVCTLHVLKCLSVYRRSS